MEWRPATIEDVSKIVERDLKLCGGQQAATFTRYQVDPHLAQLTIYGREESVVVVAQRGDEVVTFIGGGYTEPSHGPENHRRTETFVTCGGIPENGGQN
jgi:hypothetical protein